MIILDYIFYKICKFYSFFGEYSPQVFAVSLISLSQYFLLSILRSIYFIIFPNVAEYFSDNNLIVIGLLIFGFNFWRYKRIVTVQELDLRWSEESTFRSIMGGALVLLYIVGSVVGALKLSGY